MKLVGRNEKNFFDEYAGTIETTYSGMIQEKESVYILVKRIMDIIFALIGLLVTLPVIIIFAIAVKIETPGPAFFLQERVGYRGKYFKVIKIRSMGIDAEKNGAQWASKNDPRVTRIGLFIRKTRIDELPQLLNILKGDMSLVGPRPERPIFTAQFNEDYPGFIERLKVKPGLTGWAQINGGYDISPSEKLKLDTYYIDNYSIWLDIIIIIKTIKVCITGSGAR